MKVPKSIGKYSIKKQIAKGATSSVYLGVDPFTGHEVAVKVAFPDVLEDPDNGPKYQRLFMNEASLAGKLHHPNIVKLIDAVIDSEQQYIVMEYIDGGTLEPMCHVSNLQPFAKIVEYIFKCCSALEYAGRQGIIHRDIKPANIMLNGNGDIKVSDFGASLLMQSERTQVLDAVGSLSYMSPEQLNGEELTHQTDIYSLGVVMYQLLCGRVPYDGGTQAELINHILNEDLPSVRIVRPQIPPTLARVAHLAMDKDIQARYQTWNEFSSELSEIVGGLELPSGDLSETYKFNVLRQLKFFEGFLDVEIWQILHTTKWARFKADQLLMQEGASGNSFFVIAEGEASVKKEGKLLGILKKGDCFGEMAYIREDCSKRTANIIASSDTLLVKVRAKALAKTSDSVQLKVNKRLSKIIADRLATTAELYTRG